tara:strand:+ start:845 stop:1564 length:720 start_codon:yes stop_codon:yes gene_type:complete
MIIFPAIDIKEGRCVRLFKGDFNKITKYKKNPIDQAKEFLELGFNNIHIIDLDGALKSKTINEDIIKEISKIDKIKIQVGGGIRNIDNVKKFVDFGVDKVILGTAAVEDIEFLHSVCEKFNNKIALSLDVRDGCIALAGWKNQTNILAAEFIKKIANINISRIIYTDINKDGTMLGPNLEETVNLSNLIKKPFLISGGISSIEDVISIKKKNFSNIEGMIIGKAIYDGKIDINKLSELI